MLEIFTAGMLSPLRGVNFSISSHGFSCSACDFLSPIGADSPVVAVSWQNVELVAFHKSSLDVVGVHALGDMEKRGGSKPPMSLRRFLTIAS